MSKPSPTLAALSLALALALAATPAFAQEITTSHGMRTLPRTDGMTSENQFRQVALGVEDVVSELLQDIARIESSRAQLGSEVAALPDQVKSANADYERAKAAYDTANRQYLADLASYQQRQAAVEAEIQQQRAAAAAISPTLPLEEYNREIARVNDWSARLTTQRTQLDAERDRLMQTHDSVEAERVKLAAQRTDAESRLKQVRDGATGELGTTASQRAEAYKQLRIATEYLRGVREQMSRIAKVNPGASAVLDEAASKLRAYDSR